MPGKKIFAAASGKIDENEVKIEREKTKQTIEITKQEKEKTKQLAILASGQFKGATEFIKERNGIIESADNQRRVELGHAMNELQQIPDDDMNKLLRKARPLFIEMGYPLYRSAEALFIGESKKKTIFVDKFILDELKGNIVSKKPISILGTIISYNKKNGWGKFTSQVGNLYSFKVPKEKKNEMLEEILDSMRTDTIYETTFYTVSDRAGTIKYLILAQVIEQISHIKE